MMYGILIREFLPDRYSEQLVLDSPTHKRHSKLLTARRSQESVEVCNIHVYKSNARLCLSIRTCKIFTRLATAPETVDEKITVR